MLDMSGAVFTEELVLLSWADSVSLSFSKNIIAEFLVGSLDTSSLPLLGILTVAWPEGQVDVVLVLVVLGGKASLGVLVLDSVTVDDESLGLVGIGELSDNEGSTWLDVLTGKVGNGKVSLGENSDGGGSLIHDEPGSPVLWLLLELQNEVFSVLLLGEIDVSLTLGLEVDGESLLGEVWLSLGGISSNLSEVLEWVLVASPPLEWRHILVLSVDHQASLGFVGNSSLINSKLLIISNLLVQNSSENSSVTCLHTLTHLVGESKVSLTGESDCLGSLVVQEDGVSWVSLFLNLGNSIDSDFLLGHEDLSLGLAVEDKEEWLVVWVGLIINRDVWDGFVIILLSGIHVISLGLRLGRLGGLLLLLSCFLLLGNWVGIKVDLRLNKRMVFSLGATH